MNGVGLACADSRPSQSAALMDASVGSTRSVSTVKVLSYLLVCTIFIAEVMSADTSVMLPGTMRVVVASEATLL